MAKKKKKNNKPDSLQPFATNNDIEQLAAGVASLSPENKEMFYKALRYSDNMMLNHYGVLEPMGSFSDSFKRQLGTRDPCTQICTNIRRSNARQYSEKVANEIEDIPGWIVKKKNGLSPDREDKKIINKLTDFFTWNGVKYNPEADIDNISDMTAAIIEEQHILDKYAIENRFTKNGKLYDYSLIDAGTIFRVIPEGFQGNRDDIRPPRYNYILKTDIAKKLYEQRKSATPKPEEIRYVQIIDGVVCAGFTSKEMVVPIGNFSVDHRMYGQAISPVDQSVILISSFMRSLRFNANVFDELSIPRVALVMKNGNHSTQALRALQREWEANFKGDRSGYKMPILNGDANVLDLYKNARDMEYMKYLMFCGAFIFSAHGVDPAEAGLKFDQSQHLMGENQDAKMKFSKSRGLNDRLKNIERFFNKQLWLMGINNFEFKFTGLDTIDREARNRRDKELLETRKTFNEIREYYGDKPVDGGDVIGNQFFIQGIQMSQAQAAQEGSGDNLGEDMGEDIGDDMIDEVTEDVMKDFLKADRGQRIMLL